MSFILIYGVMLTILIGNCLFSIETAAFFSAKSTLNQALIALSVESDFESETFPFTILQERLITLVQSQLQQNYVYLDLELAFYFYHPATLEACDDSSTNCGGVQIKLISHNSYFVHEAEVRFEVSIGG
jgi:hypothetical protein